MRTPEMLARLLAILFLLSATAYAHDLPLSFEPCLDVNCGAAEGKAQFLARGSGYHLFLTPTQAVLDPRTSRNSRIREGVLLPALFREARESQPANSALRMKLLGARPGALTSGVDELPGKTNYFIGNDPRRWRTNVPTYAKVVYQDVYPGITLVYYGSQRELEFDLVCSPGADPKAIRLAFEGTGKIEIDSQGALALETAAGRVQVRRPLAYQRMHGVRQVISASYVRRGAREVGFELDAYEPSAPLVIDPILVYSTNIGTRGGDNEHGLGIAVDSSSSTYVTGITMSASFPITPGAFQTSLQGVDAFVTKLNAEGTGLVYSTYLGGSSFEESTGIKVDSAGNAYVTGRTYSNDFPTTPGVVQRVFGGGTSDAFVAKLNSTGSALVYSTYLGGRDLDRPYGIAIDSGGNAYVAGGTRSSDFPVAPNAFQRVLRGDWDAFVVKLNTTGTSLAYSTYLGGSDADGASGIAVDVSGNAYVAVSGRSVDFPVTPGAYRGQVSGYGSASVTKLSATGDALIYSSILGDGGLSGIAVDGSDNAYVTGNCRLAATPGAFQRVPGNVCVAKMNAAGTGFIYATHLGGSRTDAPTAIAVDASGSAYITGYTESDDFPVTSDGLQLCKNLQMDIFVTKMNPTGSDVVWSTFLGGRYSEGAWAIAVDPGGDIYLTGDGQVLTTADSFQPKGSGSFVAKISLNERPVRAVAAPFVTGAQNGASFGCQFQPNSWITVRGFNLAATTRTWGAQDIIDGRLPTSLDGVRVDVGGRAATIAYISPTQINALAPSDSTVGLSSVTVTNANGTSQSLTAQMGTSPGLFAFDPRNRRYAAATLADGTYLGPPGLFGAGVATKPAKPGDVILLYGTGFGAANPPVPSDRVLSGAAVLVETVYFTIGGVPATVQFAGMTGPGLCQFNVVIPDVSDGDQEVIAGIRIQYPGYPLPALYPAQRNIFVNVQR